MSEVLTGPRPSATRGTELGARIDALNSAVAAARGRLDDDLLDEAGGVGDRSAGRLRLSARHTVVAIAGATGSGKSSTFNALTGLDLSSTGVRRPTTSWATACVWGSEGAEEVLDWLGIPPRHQTMRDSMLDGAREDQLLEGVVLLDLPDHDSTEVSHHLEVDRLVELADLLVWVLDPQKYADAAIHDRYLAPLRSHAAVMVVVLNHIDTIAPDRRDAMIADVRRLLADDGLPTVAVYALSAREDIGVDDLRAEIAGRAEAKALTRSRIEADVRAAAARLAEASGDARTRELTTARVQEFDDALATAAGVPVLVDAAERSAVARALRAVGWPPIGWLSGRRGDPLDGLELELGEAAPMLAGRGPAQAGDLSVSRSRVTTEVRTLSDDVSAGLAPPWVASVDRASTSQLPQLVERLDAALGAHELAAVELPGWVRAVRVGQWLLLLLALAGAVWSGQRLIAGTLGDLTVFGAPVPLIVLVAALVIGLLLALVCRSRAKAAARERVGESAARLRARLHAATTDLVLDPVAAELQAYTTARAGLDAASR